MPDAAGGAEPALETRGLRRAFGDLVAVDDVDLLVPRGTLYGFLGPNGAGKSTTIKCLTGLLAPTAGDVRILGLDARREGVAVRRRIGVVPEDLALLDRLSGPETLELVGRLHGLPRAERRRRAGELLELMELTEAGDGIVADYSHGMRKKLALAAALLPGPSLLFLDEPFEGVDALAARQIRHLLSDYVARGGTIFLTSHVLEIVEKLATWVGVIDRGRLVAQGPLQDLASRADGQDLESLFVGLVGRQARERPTLDWLTT